MNESVNRAYVFRKPSNFGERLIQTPTATVIGDGDTFEWYEGSPNALTRALRGPDGEVVVKDGRIELYEFDPSPLGSVEFPSTPDYTIEL